VIGVDVRITIYGSKIERKVVEGIKLAQKKKTGRLLLKQ